MPDKKWTHEQLLAITAGGCNLLVSAAAGAGKTAVLVERIIRKITDKKDPVDIDKLLVVTFTNAAASEMRERIGDAIAEALEKEPGSRLLQKQMALLGKASITTIHSFCLEVIKNNFELIDIDPAFRIADETEALLLKTEALQELFEDIYEPGTVDERFLKLVESYGGGRDDSALQEMVLSLYNYVQCIPWPESWLSKSAEAFDIPEDTDFSQTVWGPPLLIFTNNELKGINDLLESALEECSQTEGFEPYTNTLTMDLTMVGELLSIMDRAMVKGSGYKLWDELYNAFSSFEFSRLALCGKDADKEVRERVKGLRDEAKDRLNKLKKDIYITDSKSAVTDLKKLKPLFQCLSELVKKFGDIYTNKKKKRSILDFNDLEHYCLMALTETAGEDGNIVPSAAAIELRKRFEEILVDEYQDSNLIQEVILNMVSRGLEGKPNIFMVGDVKQSIYRFRQARPELFLEKYLTYPAEDGHKNRLIQLSNNFRSRIEVINSVNGIFGRIMSSDAGELDYGAKEELRPGSSNESFNPLNRSELLLFSNAADNEEYANTQADGSEDDYYAYEEEKPDAIQAEARMAAARIKELVHGSGEAGAFRVFDKTYGECRNIQYKDIVILLRTTRGWAEIFNDELALAGIPAFADIGTGYFKAFEIQTVLSLLAIIDNPLQDIPLLSVLRSPIAGFSPDELSEIRSASKGLFFDALTCCSKDFAGDIAEKSALFLARLSKWRDKSIYMPISEFIWFLYDDTGFYSYAGAMPGGRQRQANLRLLFERARRYEETSLKGLFSFIRFIERLKDNAGDMGSAKALGENEDVVRIMSIHKSKGLEFPVVFVSGCGKKFNQQDSNRSILFHQDYGFGPDFVDADRRVSYPTLPKLALRQKLRSETLSEEMRILYVAMTRAREKLIITGTTKRLDSDFSKWSYAAGLAAEKLPAHIALRASSYLDWICPSIIRDYGIGIFKEKTGIDGPVSNTDDTANWDIYIIKDLPAQMRQDINGMFNNKLDEGFASEEEKKLKEEIFRRLEWKYPYSAAVSIPVKISVTELKRRFSEIDPESADIFDRYPVRKPRFMEEKMGLTAAERGTLLHFVMQHLELSHVSSAEEISEQLDAMIERELITAAQRRYIDTSRIAAFFSSWLGKRLLSSAAIYREVPFNIKIPLIDIEKGVDGILSSSVDDCGGNPDDALLLQGIMDCYFEEDNGLVLLDYKTDRVNAGIEELRSRYSLQMAYYSKALQIITGKKVNGAYIYLFDINEVLEFPVTPSSC